MGQIIAAAQEKGGAGKSTMIVMLASQLVKDGAKVAILDVDAQKTAHTWAKKSVTKGMDIDFASVEEQEKITPTLAKLKSEYDFVLVDTAGIESQSLFFVVMKSDIVLIPAKACEPDLAGMVKTYRKVVQIGESMDKDIPVYAVLSDVDKGTNMTNKAVKVLMQHEIPHLQKKVMHTTKLKEFLTNGGEPEGPAKREATGLLAELQTMKLLDYYEQKLAG